MKKTKKKEIHKNFSKKLNQIFTYIHILLLFGTNSIFNVLSNIVFICIMNKNYRCNITLSGQILFFF